MRNISFKISVFIMALTFLACESVRDSMTFSPDTVYGIPADKLPDFVQEHIIETKDREKLQSFYFQHKGAKASSLVIYFHGNAGNLYGRLGYAEKLFEMGTDVLLLSYRGYGKSTGGPDEEGIFTDGQAAMEYAVSRLGFTENQIVLFGRSLGSTVAIDVAQNKDLKGIVLVTPLTSGKEMAEVMGLGSMKSVAGESYNSIGKINNCTSPLLIIHGTADTTIPYEMGKKLHDTYEGEKKMVTIEGGSHNDLQDINSELFWDSVKDHIID